MALRLGVRSRILVLTLPVVILVSAAIAGVVYLSLGQLLDASARDLAVAEATELRADVKLHPIDELLAAHPLALGNRVAQVVDVSTRRVILTSDRRVTAPDRNYPNPFTTATTIEYALQNTNAVTVRVFDMMGREIRTLVAGDTQLAGQHEVVWDGRNAAGARMASGTYLYTLEVNGLVQSSVMTLLK